MLPLLDKRTADQRHYDADCSLLLDDTETITSVSVTTEPSDLTVASIVVNTQAVQYKNPDRTVAAGKAVQMLISGGVIPTGALSTQYVIRLLLQTNLNPAVEATVALRVVNND